LRLVDASLTDELRLELALDRRVEPTRMPRSRR
jgi:hypothetical protein